MHCWLPAAQDIDILDHMSHTLPIRPTPMRHVRLANAGRLAGCGFRLCCIALYLSLPRRVFHTHTHSHTLIRVRKQFLKWDLWSWQCRTGQWPNMPNARTSISHKSMMVSEIMAKGPCLQALRAAQELAIAPVAELCGLLQRPASSQNNLQPQEEIFRVCGADPYQNRASVCSIRHAFCCTRSSLRSSLALKASTQYDQTGKLQHSSKGTSRRK